MKQLSCDEIYCISGGKFLGPYIFHSNTVGVAYSAPVGLAVLAASLYAGNGIAESIKYGLAAATLTVYTGFGIGLFYLH